VIPDPWDFMAKELSDVMLVRHRIPEPGRYYHDQRTIVVRCGLAIHEERRFLWHEIVHALRGDETCDLPWLRAKAEASAEREAARRAMPLSVLEDALERSADWWDFADALKVPEPWVRFRIDIAHPAERALLSRVHRWENTA